MYKYYLPYIYSSLLVHPCDKDSNGGCSQKCVKKGDDAICACGDGFILAKDGQACDRGKQEYFEVKINCYVYFCHVLQIRKCMQVLKCLNWDYAICRHIYVGKIIQEISLQILEQNVDTI